MRNLIARLKLEAWIFDHKCDHTLEGLLSAGVDSGLVKLKVTDLYIEGMFSNGNKFCMWNANKHYAWLKKGEIGEYRWKDARPSAHTMLRFRDAAVKFLLR